MIKKEKPKSNSNLQKLTVVLICIVIFIVFRPSSIADTRRNELQQIITTNYESIDSIIIECRYNGKNKVRYRADEAEYLDLFVNLYEQSDAWEGTNVGYRQRDYNADIYFYKSNEKLYHLSLEIIAGDSKVKCKYAKHVQDGNKTKVSSLYPRQFIDDDRFWETFFNKLNPDNIKKNND